MRLLSLCCLTLALWAPAASAQGEPPYPHLANYYLSADVDDAVITALAHWDVVVLHETWTTAQLDRLRALNPNIKIFFYVIAYAIPYAPSSEWSRINMEYVRDNDLWWYDVERNVASDWPGTGMANVTQLAPVGPQGSWRQFFASRVADLVVQYPQLDGVFLDNFWRQLSWQQSYRRLDSDCSPTHNLAGCDGVMDTNTALDSLWHAALTDIATTIRSRFDQLQVGRARPLAMISNGSDDYFQWLNGTLTEYFPSGHSNDDVGNAFGYNWNHEMFNCPGGYTVAPFNPVPYRVSILNSEYWGSKWSPARESNFERHKRFTLASSLFGSGYYSLDSGHGGNQNLWWEPEYDHAGRGKGYLGLPLGPVRRLIAATGTEILTNPDFGAGTTGWWGHPFGAEGQFGVDTATWHSAPCSGRIDVESVAPSGAYKVWQAPIQLTQNVVYTLSFWARGDAGQVLEVVLYGDTCPGLYCWTGREFCLSDQWTRFETSFASSGSAAPGLNMFVRQPGTVWLDDLSLRTGDSSLFRRDFENGIVLLNYTNATQTVPLETTYYRLQVPGSDVFDGNPVVAETVPPSDARFLLRDDPTAAADLATGSAPARATLAPNRPNPFNPSTEIRFTLAADGPVHLAVLDVTGRRLRVLVDGVRQAGQEHTVIWDGHDATGRAAPSGLYLLRLSTRDFTSTRKIVLAR